MRSAQSEAIILLTRASRDRDKLVVFFTPEQGKMSGFAYGARGFKVRYGAALEPLAKVTVTWFEKEQEEAVRIEAVDLIRSLFPAQQKLVPALAAMYIAEHVDTFAQPADPNELLYRLLDRTSEALLADAPVEMVLAYFEVWILRLGGVFPSMRECAGCHRPLQMPLRYDEELAVFVCGACESPRPRVVPNDVAEALSAIARLPLDAFATLPLPHEVLFEVRAFARYLRRNFLGHELKSHDMLQGMLAETR